MTERRIHFHHSDDRFCGSKKQFRRFTFDPNEVTCSACKARDCFVLSPAAEAYVRELEAKAAATSWPPSHNNRREHHDPLNGTM